MSATPPTSVKAVAFDHGGVLTTPLVPALRRAAEAAGVDIRVVAACLAGDSSAAESPLHGYERGELCAADVEAWSDENYPGATAVLSHRAAHFVGRYLQVHPRIPSVLAALRSAGVRTAIATNSPRDWISSAPFPPRALFDAVVISSEIGARKPERGFFDALVAALDLRADEVLLVDDTPEMVESAVSYGLRGLVLTDHDATFDRLLAMVESPREQR